MEWELIDCSAVGKFWGYSRKGWFILSNSLKKRGKLLITILGPRDTEKSKWLCSISRNLLWKMKRKRKHFCSSQSPFDRSEFNKFVSHFSPWICLPIEEKIVVREGKVDKWFTYLIFNQLCDLWCLWERNLSTANPIGSLNALRQT